MNPNEIEQLMEFISWIRKEFDLTIILIEHQMRLVMGICERLKVLDFGATLAEGLPIEIQNNPKVLEAYLGWKKEKTNEPIRRIAFRKRSEHLLREYQSCQGNLV